MLFLAGDLLRRELRIAGGLLIEPTHLAAARMPLGVDTIRSLFICPCRVKEAFASWLHIADSMRN